MIVSFGLENSLCDSDVRIGEGSCARGNGLHGICITCSNIKRPRTWPDDIVVRRKIRASRRLSHRSFVCLVFFRLSLFLFLVFLPRSYPLRRIFSPRIDLYRLFNFGLPPFLSTRLGSSVASGDCRAQKYLKS